MRRSSGAAPGPSGGGPVRTCCWKARSSSSSSAAKIPARVPNLRNTVPLPSPARSASPSMVSWPAPCPAIISRAVTSRSRRLRAASARSAGGDPQITGWLIAPTLRPEYNRGKVRLRLQCRTAAKEGPADDHDRYPGPIHDAARRADARVGRHRPRRARVQRGSRGRPRRRARGRPRPYPGRGIGDDQHLGDPAGNRHRGRHQRRRALRLGAQPDVRAGLRDPGAADEGDRRPAGLRPGQRPRGHPRRNARHRVGLGQPARLLRLGRGQRHLRDRRAEARAYGGGRARADLPAQPGTGGRTRDRCLRAAQLGGEGHGDPPGTARPCPHRAHPPGGRVLMREPGRLAVLGAGHVGPVIARLAIKAGYPVAIATSGDPEDIALIAELVIPGAQPRWASDAVADADIVVLAIPLHRFPDLDPALLDGKLVVHAMNYWPAGDGVLEPFEDRGSSEVVARRLASSAVVKALNHIGYPELEDRARPATAPDRRAAGVAGDDPAAAATIAGLIDRIGYDPVRLESLRAGRVLQPGGPVVGVVLTRPDFELAVREEQRQRSLV